MLILSLILQTSYALAGLSSWDQLQLELLREYSTPLRWDNVEGPPQWISGPKPHRGLGGKVHGISLAPGQEVTLCADQRTWLRLVGQGHTLRQDDLEISVSTDAHLFTATDPISTIDPYSLLLCLSQESPCLVRLARPVRCTSAVVFAAFLSREESFVTMAPYRDAVRLPGKAVRLRRDDETSSETAWLLKPGQSVPFSIAGPARVQLIARVPWPGTEIRAEQPVALRLESDGARPELLLLSPQPDLGHRTRVGGMTEPLSQRVSGFFDVPEGSHVYQLESSSPIYLSVFQQAHRQFLFPGLNALSTELPDYGATRTRGQIPGTEVREQRAGSEADLAGIEQEAWGLSRDNSHLETGAQAADWLNRMAQTRRDYPPAATSAEALRRDRTLYRELLPAHMAGSQEIGEFFFSPARLRDPSKPQRPLAVVNPTIEQAVDLFASGHFTPVPYVLSSALLYRLPARSECSQLRIAVLSGRRTRARLFVQFDDDKPRRLDFDLAPVVAVDQLEPSSALATLKVIEEVQGQRDHGTAAGSGEQRAGSGGLELPLPLCRPGVVDLPLPAKVRQVRVYQETETPDLAVSIAYRAAKAFSFGEARYLELIRQMDPGVLMSVLRPNPNQVEEVTNRMSELWNHCLPLIRLLKAHTADFEKSIDIGTGGVGRQDYRTTGLQDDRTGEEGSELESTAQKLDEQGEQLAALGLWNQIFWNGAAADRQKAVTAMMFDLESLGEEFLAAQYARYLLVTSSAREMPGSAIALLESNAKETEDFEALERLRAFLFVRCPCPEHLRALVEALALNSRDEMALWAGLMLAPEERPADVMLPAALHLNWWQTFDQLADRLPDPATEAFWRAQKDLAFYRFAEAEQELSRAGERGRPMLDALRRGMGIRERLASGKVNERLEAVFEWEEWQGAQLGPRRWQTARDVTPECSATELVFSSEQNQFTSLFRTEPGKQLRLRFLGPLRLQVEARPVLSVPFQAPLDDWLEIAEYGITNRTPVCQSGPNPNLRLATSSNALLGTKTTATLEWGPGFHQVEICLAGHVGLFRVLEEVPVLPLRVLPTLNLERMSLVLQRGNEKRARSREEVAVEQGGVWWVEPQLGEQEQEQGARARGDKSDEPVTSLTQLQQLRLALRLQGPPVSIRIDQPETLGMLPSAEQWLAACRSGLRSQFTAWDDLSPIQRGDYLLASGQIEKLIEWISVDRNPKSEVRNAPRSPEVHSPRSTVHGPSSGPSSVVRSPSFQAHSPLTGAIFQQLVWLLQVSEMFPAWREEAQARGGFLLWAATNCPAGSRAIAVRLGKDASWKLLPLTPLSAGVRPVQFRTDESQNPAIRIRRALLPPAAGDEFTLTAEGVFTASMDLKSLVQARIGVELVKAGFSPMLPVTVALQLDAGQVQHLALSVDEPEKETSLSIAEGTHVVRLWMEDPAVDQFVRVKFSGQSTDATNLLWTRSMAEAAQEKRFFYEATKGQPIRFFWKGPALLRLDEWRETPGRPPSVSTRLEWVAKGEQEVRIGPAPGESESWYRIYVHTAETNAVEVRPNWVTREPEEVPPPKLSLAEATAPSQAQLTDYYELGGQEDGTWTFGTVLAHRRPFELSYQQSNVANEFVEADAAFRKVNPAETLWLKTRALGRVHRPGDLTFGLTEDLRGHPQAMPFEWGLSGEGYVGTTGPDRRDTEGALYTAFEIGQHRHLNRKLELYPYAGGFAHYLTLDSEDVRQYSYVDQDLFTAYRADHRWGWVLGSRLEYRPWLDSFITVGADLVSNEDFGPDHWGMRFAWQQLLGPLRGEVAYGFRHSLDGSYGGTEFLQGISAGVYGEYWLNGRHRLELGGQFRHDWPTAGNSYFLVLRWDFSQGRGYKDYAPEDLVFRDIRSRRIPSAFNNMLSLGPQGALLP